MVAPLDSSIPDEMQAIEIAQPGGPEQLRAVMRPLPRPAHGEVLLKVAVAGVNRPDVLQRLGRYSPPPGASDIPGLEVAGVVAAVGPDVTQLVVGDRVTALLAGGGYAAYAVAAVDLCLPVPDGFTLTEAAALPETVFTVWANLFESGNCRAGSTVLIHGGTSGIGTMAIQLATVVGARVFATAGSPAKARICEQLGAFRGIDYRNEDFVDVIRRETANAGVDIVLDMVSGSYVARNMAVAAPFGRIVCIAVLGGTRAEIDVSVVMHKRLTLTGSTLRSRPLEQKAALARSVRRIVWPLLSAGKVRPVIHETFPLADAAAAHRMMETSTHIGKLMLIV